MTCTDVRRTPPDCSEFSGPPPKQRAWKSRWACQLFCLATCLAGLSPNETEADFLQPPPRYTPTERLREDASLHAIAFADTRVGLAVGDHGTVWVTRDGGQRWEPAATPVGCRLDDAIWLDAQRAVAVGGGYDRITGVSRGVVLLSDDGGRRWRQVGAPDLPRLTRIRLGADGETLWALGDWSPAARSRAFRSDDAGRSWQATPPPAELLAAAEPPDVATRLSWTQTAKAPAAIRGRCRVDSQLWAVGDHGFIVHSPDGGASWQLQRGRGRHTSVLVVARRPASAPWPLIGHEALEFRQRVAMLLAEPTAAEPDRATPVDLARQATRHLGGAAADSLNGRVERGGSAVPASELVAWLAMHRPRVVLLDGSLPSEAFEAYRAAAVRHGVPRVVRYELAGAESVGRAESMLHRNALLTRVGMLARDLWEDALQIVAPGQPTATSITLRRVHDISGSPRRGDSVASGLQESPGAMLDAQLPAASARQLQTARARLEHPTRIARLLATSNDRESFAAAVRSLATLNAKEDRFRLLWATMRAARERQDRSREEAVLQLLTQVGPSTARGWARLQLDARSGSREWSLLQSLRLESPQAAARDGVTSEVVPVSPFQIRPAAGSTTAGGGSGSPVIQAAGVAPTANLSGTVGLESDRTDAASDGQDVDLAWEFHPMVLVVRDAARRRGGESGLQPAAGPSADLQRLAADPSQPHWARLLGDNASEVVEALRTPMPPRLDQRHDDPCWQRVSPLVLNSPDGRSSDGDSRDDITGIELRAAYDDDYVYFAIRCPVAQLRADSASTARSGKRDQDLTQVDRLQLRIDTDRDLMTAWSLEVTAAGRTRDALDGHVHWQPTWYVARSRDDDAVGFEVAVLRRDVADLPLFPGQRWYLSARCVPAGEPASEHPLPRPADWVRIDFK